MHMRKMVLSVQFQQASKGHPYGVDYDIPGIGSHGNRGGSVPLAGGEEDA